MYVFVKRFESKDDCKRAATKFVVYVSDLFEAQGYELNEKILSIHGECLWVDTAYLRNWNSFSAVELKDEDYGYDPEKVNGY